MYDIIYSKQAKEDLAKLRKSEPAAHKKAVSLLLELMEHPLTGTGHLTLLIIRLFMTREDVM